MATPYHKAAPGSFRHQAYNSCDFPSDNQLGLEQNPPSAQNTVRVSGLLKVALEGETQFEWRRILSKPTRDVADVSLHVIELFRLSFESNYQVAPLQNADNISRCLGGSPR